MNYDTAMQTVEEMLASGKYAKAAASPDPTKPMGTTEWIVQATTAGPEVREVERQ